MTAAPRDLPKPARRKVTVWRPAGARAWSAEIERARLDAPFGFPPAGVVALSFLDLPGDNEQRGQHWAQRQGWHELLRSDFTTSIALQRHPGLIPSPRVLVASAVGGASDPLNLGARYKHAIDLLQLPQTSVSGRRTGLLGLIESDRALRLGPDDFREAVARKKDGEGRTRRFVCVYVWGEA